MLGIVNFYELKCFINFNDIQYKKIMKRKFNTNWI